MTVYYQDREDYLAALEHEGGLWAEPSYLGLPQKDDPLLNPITRERRKDLHSGWGSA